MYKNIENKRKYARNWFRNYHLKIRIESLSILGGKCVDCGESDMRVLQFDHKNLVRRTAQQRNRGSRLVIRDILNGILTKKEIEIRCANCHMIKTYTKDKFDFNCYKN